MSALSTALGNDAAQHTLTHKGKTYTVRLIDQAAKTTFEQWLFGRARGLARHLHEGSMSEIVAGRPDGNDEGEHAAFAGRVAAEEARYEQELLTLNRDFIAGTYAFESQLAAQALQTPAGLLALAADLFSVDRDTMFRLTVERGPEVKALISLVLSESLPQPRGNADPNACRPL